MAIWTKNANQQAIQQHQNQANQMGGYVGTGPMQGLAGQQYPTPEQHLQTENRRLTWELNSQKSIRAMDSVLLKRHYRVWAWLMDAHPEVIKEFEAVESLLKASGEEF